MTINGNTAALVVLVKHTPMDVKFADSESVTIKGCPTRRVESAHGNVSLRLCVDGMAPPFPVILDAAAWQSPKMSLPSPASMLRAAGWDIRPPLWRDGKAANPTSAELLDAAERVGVRGADAPTRALMLAASFQSWSQTAAPGAAPAPGLTLPTVTVTGTAAPCTARAAGDARNTMTFAASDASPTRFINSAPSLS